MHLIEPYFRWRHLYIAADDLVSPFYGRVYSEFEYTHSIYDHLIHPQWDGIDSPTLFTKVLMVDYGQSYAIIELIGEWNDLLHNDIMHLKRNLIDSLLHEGIIHFILVCENVLNFHSSDDSYYSEWFDEVEEGWICLLNSREHILEDMSAINLDYFLLYGEKFNEVEWRKYKPTDLFNLISKDVTKRLSV